MELKVIGSSSKGNGYILDDGTDILLIETGINFKELAEQIPGGKTSRICGCLVSHIHGDHAKRIKQYGDNAIHIYSNKKTLQNSNITEWFVHPMEDFIIISIKNFTVYSFPLVHGVDCSGFVISHPQTGTFCFITDTQYCKYDFAVSGITFDNIMIECNYDKETINENVNSGNLNKTVYKHVLNSHMELQTSINFVNHNAPEATNLVLLHMSRGNLNQQRMINGFRESGFTGNIHLAKKGLSIDFNKTPF
jgi:phosphoribosyl 1,2-cyclic phosphodiesterase